MYLHIYGNTYINISKFLTAESAKWPSTVKIYNNDECGTSRNTLALIQNAGIEPTVVHYLQMPPSQDELRRMIQEANLTVRQAIRSNVAPYSDLGLDQEDWSDEQLIDFMLQYPLLINRPFVVTELGTRLARPSEVGWDILPFPQKGAFSKEDGEKIVDENGQRLK